jgi:FlaA1/EpsC-like NDP-sugar epimerase
VLSSHPVKVQTVPTLAEILSGHAPLHELRPVPIEDLLGRERVEPHAALLKKNVEGKAVLVTGAGGSIGSELCRSIAALHPRVLVLLDMSEHALFQIEHELRTNRQAEGGDPSQGGIYAVLGSVEDELLVRQVLKSYDIETVFHAAAYKHVPMVELNVVEGVRNNVLCTKVLLQAIQESSVSTFVMVSSDKAVRPTSVMGASKRVAELLVQAAAARTERCKMSIVRFGNVLDSSGSVIPLFRTQMQNGGPITVTHPEVTRFFMTIPEAAELVIQAGALGEHGEVFHLDMGKPIKILDLAKQFLKLHGLRPRLPGEEGDIEIQFIGLRPGEKLYEELLLDGTAQPTVHQRIFCAHERFIPIEELSPLITRLVAACVARDETVTISLLRRVVDGYRAAEPIDAATARAAANPKPVLIATNERRGV